jgi:hypothetical protein
MLSTELRLRPNLPLSVICAQIGPPNGAKPNTEILTGAHSEGAFLFKGRFDQRELAFLGAVLFHELSQRFGLGVFQNCLQLGVRMPVVKEVFAVGFAKSTDARIPVFSVNLTIFAEVALIEARFFHARIVLQLCRSGCGSG